jgi:hypothetical protein
MPIPFLIIDGDQTIMIQNDIQKKGSKAGTRFALPCF